MNTPLDADNAYGWFEDIYEEGLNGGARPPWSGMEPSRWLTRWEHEAVKSGAGRSALVVGCGLGDDAEWLAQQGFETTAFDIAPSAIKWARQRFSESKVNYLIADLFHPSQDWIGAFDFVFESRTIQALPPELNPKSVEAVSRLVAPGGHLLVVCLGRPKIIEIQGPPWPLTREDIDTFQQHELREMSFEEFNTDQHTPVQRWRIHYQRHA